MGQRHMAMENELDGGTRGTERLTETALPGPRLEASGLDLRKPLGFVVIGFLLAGCMGGPRDAGTPPAPPASLEVGVNPVCPTKEDERGAPNEEPVLATGLQVPGSGSRASNCRYTAWVRNVGTTMLEAPFLSGSIKEGSVNGLARPTYDEEPFQSTSLVDASGNAADRLPPGFTAFFAIQALPECESSCRLFWIGPNARLTINAGAGGLMRQETFDVIHFNYDMTVRSSKLEENKVYCLFAEVGYSRAHWCDNHGRETILRTFLRLPIGEHRVGVTLSTFTDPTFTPLASWNETVTVASPALMKSFSKTY